MTPIWSYGVTTVPERAHDELPRTIQSLRNAGFDQPTLFVDGSDGQSVKSLGLSYTARTLRVKTFGNWFLALLELYIGKPYADRFAIFQDDIVSSLGLRKYLDGCRFPERGYWNLYTWGSNQDIAPPEDGWFKSNQRGKGALGLVFDRECVVHLLGHQLMLVKPQDTHRGTFSVDGAISDSLRGEWVEWCHNPSLLQHTGTVSRTRGLVHPPAPSFRGEDYDLCCLRINNTSTGSSDRNPS